MKNKILPLLLSLTAFSTAHAAVYIDLRLSHLMAAGTPDIGDVGRETGTDFPSVAASMAIGYEISPRLSLELRYTHLGDLTINKVSANWTPFPSQIVLPAVRRYDFEQRTDLWGIAVPVQVWKKGNLSLQLTPLLQIEHTDVKFRDQGTFPPLPDIDFVPPGYVFLRRSTTEVQPGAEVALSYHLGSRTTVLLHYTYTPLSTFDAHLFGAGLQAKF